MKIFEIVILTIVLCSCSSMKKTIIYSSLAGGLSGAIGEQR